jgi:hypothetical protein
VGTSSEGVKRRDARLRPWRDRPRRLVGEILSSGGWRLIVLPFAFAPMLAVRMIWDFYGVLDWVWLALSLIPWIFLRFWLRRPTVLVSTSNDADGSGGLT